MVTERLTENPTEVWSPTVDVEAIERYDPDRPITAKDLRATTTLLWVALDGLARRVYDLENAE